MSHRSHTEAVNIYVSQITQISQISSQITFCMNDSQAIYEICGICETNKGASAWDEFHTEAEISYVTQIPQISQIYAQIVLFFTDKYD